MKSKHEHMLRHRIIVGSVISLLGILLLGSLYARQRQRARIALLANAACEKEREFLELQKETEQRLTRKYIDGLESERERMATELHDDVCNNLLALEMNIRTISTEEGADLDKQLDLLNNTRERLRKLSHELMPPVFQYATLDELLADYVLHLSLPEGIFGGQIMIWWSTVLARVFSAILAFILIKYCEKGDLQYGIQKI